MSEAVLIAARSRGRRSSESMRAALSKNVLGSPRFEPVRVLGEGGSGIVYEVQLPSRSVDVQVARRHSLPRLPSRSADPEAPTTLALKVLRAEHAFSPRERRRFLEEAERMQRLDAPGLVKLVEAGLLPDGRPYLAMPLLDGETLAERLRRGPLPASVAVRWFDVLARAVHALHASGMVHRDVKPENVIVVDDTPVLLDFGIARDIDDETTTTAAEGCVRGTPAYMAPERFFGAPASVRSDVYELGVVLYTMLVGRLPWGSEKNVTERLNPASPRDAGADVSRALATVILKALSTRPEMRPASAAELASDVAAAAAESSAPSRRTLDVEIDDREMPGFVTQDVAPAPRVDSDEPRGRFAFASRRRIVGGIGIAFAATLVIATTVTFGARAVRDERGATSTAETAQPSVAGPIATTVSALPTPTALSPTSEALSGSGVPHTASLLAAEDRMARANTNADQGEAAPAARPGPAKLMGTTHAASGNGSSKSTDGAAGPIHTQGNARSPRVGVALPARAPEPIGSTVVPSDGTSPRGSSAGAMGVTVTTPTRGAPAEKNSARYFEDRK